MQIRLKPYHKNLYSVNGILICGETVHEWISAICQLNIDLQKVETYAVPGIKANSLYGCVLFFNGIPLPKDIRNHQYLQYAENKLLMLEQSTYLPAVDEEELKSIAPGKKILLHPIVGSVILDEPVNWADLLEFKEASLIKPKKPVPGVYVPSFVKSYTLELSDEKLMNDLLNPPTEKELIENLPFDVKKLMKGNKREMEKYLKYLEEHPDKALEMALPLDVLGSFRGDNKGTFSFSNNWLKRLFTSSNSGSRGNYTGTIGANNYWWIGIVCYSMIRFITCNTTTNHTDTDFKYDVQVVKQQSVLDSHYSSIMISKNIAMISSINSKDERSGNREEKYNSVQKEIEEIGPKIKDSLTVMYTSISKRKTDSVLKIWKKSAADSIRKIAGNTSFQKALKEAAISNREKIYRDYALYYGVMKDSGAFELTPETTMKPLKKETVQKEISTWSILLLSIVLMGLSFLIVEWKAPKVAGGKISAGQGEIPVLRIILVLIILTGCIMYILKPLVENYGFGWLTAGVCILLLMLLYRLFAKGLTIFNANNKK